MTALFFPITGVMLGFEFVYDEEEDTHWFVLDLLIVRVMITNDPLGTS